MKKISDVKEHEDVSLINVHFICEKNPFSKTNPNGYINFGTAQNYLIWDLIKEKLQDNAHFLENHDTHYGSLEGTEAFREFLVKYLLKHSSASLSVENIIVAASAWSIFEMTVFYFAQEKQITVLLPENFNNTELDIIENRTQVKLNKTVLPASQIINRKYLSSFTNTSFIKHRPIVTFVNIESFGDEENFKDILQFSKENKIYFIINVSANFHRHSEKCFHRHSEEHSDEESQQNKEILPLRFAQGQDDGYLLFLQCQFNHIDEEFSFGAAISNDFVIKKLKEQINFYPLSTYPQKFVLNTPSSEEFLTIISPPADFKNYPQRFSKDLAKLMSKWAQCEISEDNLFVNSGATAALEAFAFIFSDKNVKNKILIPAPYYSGFDHAFSDRAKLDIIPLYPSHSEKKISPADLMTTIERNENTKAVLICSPINPTGFVYTKNEITAFVNFAEQFKIHIIFDEMYAHSVFPNVEFFSALNIKSDYVHVIWGLAKDFGLSGFKVGVAHTQNKKIKDILKRQNFLYAIANNIFKNIETLVENEKWFFNTITHNKKLILESYHLLTNFLDKYNINYEKAEAGIFAWIDLSPYLKEQSYVAEMELFQKIFTQCKLSISPGQLFHGQKPGWFRLCYVTDKETLLTGLKRLMNLLTSLSE